MLVLLSSRECGIRGVESQPDGSLYRFTWPSQQALYVRSVYTKNRESMKLLRYR